MLISRRPCSLRISVAAASTAALAASLRGRPRLFGMTAALTPLILVAKRNGTDSFEKECSNESDWRPTDAATGQDGHGENRGRGGGVGHGGAGRAARRGATRTRA